MIIKPVETNEELNEFLQMEYDVSVYFKPFANKLGIEDIQLRNYTIESSKKYFSEDYIRYVAYSRNKIIGMLLLKKSISEFDGEEVIKIIDIYVKPNIRNKGYGKKMIEFVINKYKRRVELSCFYEAPANEFYKHIGGKSLESTYSFDTDTLKKIKNKKRH